MTRPAGGFGNGPKFDRAILAFSSAYAKQNECDYQQLVKPVRSGRIVPHNSCEFSHRSSAPAPT